MIYEVSYKKIKFAFDEFKVFCASIYFILFYYSNLMNNLPRFDFYLNSSVFVGS